MIFNVSPTYLPTDSSILGCVTFCRAVALKKNQTTIINTQREKPVSQSFFPNSSLAPSPGDQTLSSALTGAKKPCSTYYASRQFSTGCPPLLIVLIALPYLPFLSPPFTQSLIERECSKMYVNEQIN